MKCLGLFFQDFKEIQRKIKTVNMYSIYGEDMMCVHVYMSVFVCLSYKA